MFLCTSKNAKMDNKWTNTLCWHTQTKLALWWQKKHKSAQHQCYLHHSSQIIFGQTVTVTVTVTIPHFAVCDISVFVLSRSPSMICNREASKSWPVDLSWTQWAAVTAHLPPIWKYDNVKLSYFCSNSPYQGCAASACKHRVPLIPMVLDNKLSNPWVFVTLDL